MKWGAVKKFFRNIRHWLEYVTVLVPYVLLRLLPHGGVRALAWLLGHIGYGLVPGMRRICCANIAAAFPDWEDAQVKRTARASMFHLFYNLFEFFWMTGKPRRVERWTRLGERIDRELKRHVADGTRIIFVNPHLGSWEASGLMAPYYSGLELAAVAKPMRNPYLNRLLNNGNREKNAGVRIIFSSGAARASWKALRDGASVGLLVDQNTKVADGGCFVNFFGLPVPSSRLPVTLYRRCRLEGVPAVIGVAASLRREDGGIQPEFDYPVVDLAAMEDETEALQVLMQMSEALIRRHPEQYLWFYKRFQHIPREADETLAKRYPFYARRVSDRFLGKRGKK